MKFITFKTNNTENLGILVNDKLYKLIDLDNTLPNDMLSLLNGGDALMQKVKVIYQQILTGEFSQAIHPIEEYNILAPVPKPTSCRDGYAFRQHVAAARRNRGVEMIKEFDEYPVFYFTNHNSIQGPGNIECMPDHFERLDFELEVAIVIGKKGRNIKVKDADSFIAGYTIMNDMSARTLQMEEMLLNLGPAKGKDFSTVIGPWLVTPDELEKYKVPAKNNHIGNNYGLKMNCWVNDILVSSGSMADMDWTFAEIIERCSYGVDLFPGDVIGSGTVGTGCFLELNGTGLLNDKNYKPQWLKDGDKIEMKIDGLGELVNSIHAVDTDWSILKLKK